MGTIWAQNGHKVVTEEKSRRKKSAAHLQRFDFLRNLMVGRDGFEPSTNWLKANCSTTELTAPKEALIIRISK